MELFKTPPHLYEPVVCVNGHNDWDEGTWNDTILCVVCGETAPAYNDAPTEYSDDECDDWDW
jgi:hypothetical protein